MPICFIDAPPGIRTEAKKRMMEKITTAIDEAYHIGDTLTFSANTPRRASPWKGGSSPRTQKSLRRSKRSAREASLTGKPVSRLSDPRGLHASYR